MPPIAFSTTERAVWLWSLRGVRFFFAGFFRLVMREFYHTWKRGRIMPMRISRPVLLLIVGVCLFVEAAGHIATNGRINGWDESFIVTFMVIVLVAGVAAVRGR